MQSFFEATRGIETLSPVYPPRLKLFLKMCHNRRELIMVELAAAWPALPLTMQTRVTEQSR